jgi:hypothetical protein
VSRRGGLRPGSGRPKVPTEQDPDRFFIVIWRALFRLLGYGSRDAGHLAAHLVSAEPLIMSDVERALRGASTTVNHHADTLETRIAGLVRKAERSSESDPWIERSETAIESLILAAFMLARSHLSDDAHERLPAAAKILVARLHELGWGELFARLETRIAETERERLGDAVKLAVRLRAHVNRDARSREIESIHGAEGPGRIGLCLERLLAGLDVIGLDRDAALTLVQTVARHSCPPIRVKAFDLLNDAPQTTSAIADALRLPTTTTRRILEDLLAQGLAVRERGKDEAGEEKKGGADESVSARWRCGTISPRFANRRFSTPASRPSKRTRWGLRAAIARSCFWNRRASPRSSKRPGSPSGTISRSCRPRACRSPRRGRWSKNSAASAGSSCLSCTIST